MDFRQLEYFISIVEEGSLSGAAQKLYITQPTLSQFLIRLEQEEKTPLMKRGRNNSLMLTEAGRLYYKSAKEILRIRTEYQHQLSDLVAGTEKRLIFGVVAERGMQLLMQITKQLYEKYGGYENDHILTRQESAKTLQEMVANCELDAAFSAYNTKNPRLAYIDFPPIELVMVLRKDHPMARFGSEHPAEYLPRLPLKQLENIPVATLHKLTVLRDGLDQYCEENDAHPTIRFEVHSVSNVFTIVDSGMACGICTHSSHLTPNLLPNFAFIGLDPPLYYSTAIYYNKNCYRTRFLQDFLNVAKDLVQEETEIRKKEVPLTMQPPENSEECCKTEGP